VEGISVSKKTPEGYVLASVLEYLAVKRIFAVRMNSGAVRDITGRPVRMHEPGTADVLALPMKYAASKGPTPVMWQYVMPVWIECKAGKGKQSELQKDFQKRVEDEGHIYVLAFGIEDVEKVL
jgi:hypothetical protein